jgi:hypothetical protein
MLDTSNYKFICKIQSNITFWSSWSNYKYSSQKMY